MQNQKLRIALVQKNGFPNDIIKNFELAKKHIEESSKMGADIVLFPEMWSNNYAPPFKNAFDNPFDIKFEKQRQDWIKQAINEDNDFIKQICSSAKENNIGVILTYLAKKNEKPQNVAIFIDKNGNIILKYAKVHTCDFSLEALLENGTSFNVCDFCGVKIGIMICFDREFPESARVLSLKGAEIILVPNACDMNKARLNQLSTRAFENMIGIAMANYPRNGWGNSCAFSPIVFNQEGMYVDNQIFMADDISEKIYVVEFDVEEIRRYRENEVWGDKYRKPIAYEGLSRK